MCVHFVSTLRFCTFSVRFCLTLIRAKWTMFGWYRQKGIHLLRWHLDYCHQVPHSALTFLAKKHSVPTHVACACSCCIMSEILCVRESVFAYLRDFFFKTVQDIGLYLWLNRWKLLSVEADSVHPSAKSFEKQADFWHADGWDFFSSIAISMFRMDDISNKAFTWYTWL